MTVAFTHHHTPSMTSGRAVSRLLSMEWGQEYQACFSPGTAMRIRLAGNRGPFENENILFECRVFCDCYIFYPVKSSLTLKPSIQNINGVNPSSVSLLGEGICQRLLLLFYREN